MAAVCIVFSPDAENWFSYFENYLQRVFPDIVVEPFREPSLLQLDSNSSKSRTTMKQSKVNIFIISPAYLQFCIENSQVTLKDSSSSARSVIFLCGTGLDDFVMEDANGHRIADRLPAFDKQCLLSYPQHDEMLERVVAMLESEQKSCKIKDENLICRKGDKPAHKANGKRKRKTKGFKFIPCEVNCEGTSDVIISFDEMDASEDSEINVEIELEDDADGEGPTRVKAVYLNPYTCTFRAPERRAGVVKVCVYSQGKALGTEELRYSSPAMDAISGIHQIYIRQLDEICALLSSDQMLELDNCLALILHDESKGMIPAVAFEYFHKVYRFQSSDVSEFKLPTMFHLAAKYGLHELCRQFTDLPDARYSFCTYDVDRKLPEDIARSTNHFEISSMLESLRESDVFQKLYDSYIIMNRGDLSPEYLLQSSKTVKGGSDDDADDNDYEDVPTEADMCASAELRFKSDVALKSKSDGASGVDEEDRNDSSCSFIDKYLQPMENPYECRMNAQMPLAPVKLVEGRSTIPRNQQELIQIMEQVKNKQLTMTEAEVLFKEWKIKHNRKPASVKHKEEQLAKIREEACKANKDKKETSILSQFLGKKAGVTPGNQSIPRIMPGAKNQPAKPSAEVMGDRTSTTSTSSRESTCSIRSRTSTTSGIDIDETIQEEEVVPRRHQKSKSSNRKSIHQQILANELTSPGALEPPPLPSRVSGVTRPSVPLPRLERAELPKCTGRYTDSPDADPCVQAQGAKHSAAGTASSKNLIHQESMPELNRPLPMNQPRKFSLPNVPSQIPPRGCLVPAVPEEDDELDKEPTTLRASPKLPQRRADGPNEELKKLFQQKADSMKLNSKATAKGLPQDSESSNSDASSTSTVFPLKPVKRLPAVPPKGATGK